MSETILMTGELNPVQIRLLDDAEFQSTFVAPMRRLEEVEDSEAVDIKDYVAECIQTLGLPTTLDDIEIHHVYVSSDSSFTHVMLFYGKMNPYLVVVTDNRNKSILGHHLLDLNALYGTNNG